MFEGFLMPPPLPCISMKLRWTCCFSFLWMTFGAVGFAKGAPPSAVPDAKTLDRAFGNEDAAAFREPPRVFRPETWFHFIGGNVATQGITADLEAIAGAGIAGVQLFHGQFGGPWPGGGTPVQVL